MKIDIPFKVELYPSYEELYCSITNVSNASKVDTIIEMIYRSIIGEKPFNPMMYYDELVSYFKGTWIVIGTNEAWGGRGLVLIQPGRSVCVLPTIFCKVVENPIGEPRRDDSKT